MTDQKITQLTANTAPATTDLLPHVDDPSGTPETKKMTFSDFMKVVGGLTADTSPTSSDFLCEYDASASDAKKVSISNIFKGFYASATELTIASDAITVTQNAHKLQPASGTADDLSTISGTSDGWAGVLYASDFGTDTITIKHNVGNILCVGGSDITLSHGMVFWYSNGTKVFMSGGGGGTVLANSERTMKNGKFSVSVASNDLTVALKTLAGSDPSASDPVKIVIGGTERTITSALSVTKNDATNWCNAGSAELATKLIQYFIYLGYNATDGVVIGFSRIPYARSYGDFSATSTNEKYAGISTIANAASTDPYVNVGRFSATLSAGAAYTWSISGTGDVVNYPIFETDILSWQPAYSASASMTYTSVTTTVAEYQICRNVLNLEMQCIGTTGGTPSTTLFATTPFGARNYTAQPAMTAWVADAAATAGFVYMDTSVNNKIGARKYDGSNYASGANRYINANGKYFI